MQIPISISFILPVLLIGLILFTALKGYKTGLIAEAIKTVSLYLAVIAAWLISSQFHSSIAIIHKSNFETSIPFVDQQIVSVSNQGALFLVCIVLCLIAIKWILYVMRNLNKIPVLGNLNKLLGGAFGLLKGLLYGIFFILVLSSPLIDNHEEVLQSSGLINIKQTIQDNVPIAKEILNTFDLYDQVIKL